MGDIGGRGSCCAFGMMQILLWIHVDDDFVNSWSKRIFYVWLSSGFMCCMLMSRSMLWLVRSLYVFCFVLLCCAWPLMLVCNARFLFSGRMFSHKVDFAAFWIPMLNVSHVSDHIAWFCSQVLFVSCCWIVLLLRLNVVRHDARSFWIVLLFCLVGVAR